MDVVVGVTLEPTFDPAFDPDVVVCVCVSAVAVDELEPLDQLLKLFNAC